MDLLSNSTHERFMKQAIQLAENAGKLEEIPVGAIVVKDNNIIGRGYNQCESLKDPTAHAEMIAITAAANTVEDWRLTDCTLYVTKEPCPMCAGAIINSRLKMVIFGTYDEEKGCCGSLYQLCGDPRFGNNISVRGGIFEDKCKELLKTFFKTKRKE
ncbi:MAG TPA: tRNA adenosine(34) deaminase TadA [Candidatus Marinimicrobia bacterium]|jgi:tRNA(adenine34) deaminase|nr:tRNA-specific adenosine deaminase [Candidatus Neomarinimicrobiota bacterium]MDP6143547.1 tRNA adenosine(34) deaminase TadA [Candidatus Neomarinimicrobiota bacterium]MDP6261448.1 tRNA adenosine(34) deaminase TadA [Candidatus Neomarinimicrobiota bacterium]MDP7128766.1 tRNA adenosine(34) deaminase TadA [Candidatus Neomarinimicrobiota bacterium]MDP7337477.1 tRNA adenosine(34) deaminase TadA [Candidatus Neomarinimicrobiota bacterium]|tara:strand:+ start:235 stop:705 length:471 start_codon:yes stop_codon:yes gene_type:complete